MATSTHGDAPACAPSTLVHLITRLSLGGSATNTIDSAAAAARAGYRTVLATGPDDGELGTDALPPDASVRLETIPALTRDPSPFRDLKALFQIFALLRHENPDIVHTHTSKAGFLGRLAAFAARVPVVIHTSHGHIFNGYYGRAATTGFVWLERFAARLTDRLVFLTEAEARDHRKLKIGRVGGYTIIPSGVDLEALRRRAPERTVARHRLGWPGQARVVLGVGRLVPVKGFDLLLRALPAIRRECPEARLVLVGEGPDHSKLERLANELAVGEWVEMAGAREDVSPYLAAADVLVAPSRNEGQGRTLVEAMALRLPVVGANVGGIPDVLNDGTCGLLVPPEDPDIIARAVLTILGDEELQARYRKRGVAQAELFSLPVMEAKLLALYREAGEARKLRPDTSPALVESGE